MHDFESAERQLHQSHPGAVRHPRSAQTDRLRNPHAPLQTMRFFRQKKSLFTPTPNLSIVRLSIVRRSLTFAAQTPNSFWRFGPLAFSHKKKSRGKGSSQSALLTF
jgi:hypothetical protein